MSASFSKNSSAKSRFINDCFKESSNNILEKGAVALGYLIFSYPGCHTFRILQTLCAADELEHGDYFLRLLGM